MKIEFNRRRTERPAPGEKLAGLVAAAVLLSAAPGGSMFDLSGASARAAELADRGAFFLAPLQPNTADGRPILQAGLNQWRYYAYDEPFLNRALLMGNQWTAQNDWPDQTTMGPGALKAGGWLDPVTLLPRAVPPGFSSLRSGLFRGRASEDPASFSGDWAVVWEGDADIGIELGCAATQKKIGRNRLEFFCKAGEPWTRLKVTRIGPQGFRNLQVFRADEEAALKAGQVFRPQFLAAMRRYRVLRSMDVQNPMMAGARSVDRMATKANAHWGADPGYNPDGFPMGPPVEALFDLAVAADAALWMNVAGPIGAPPELDTVAATGPNRTGVRAAAYAHAAEIVASPEWDRYADEIVRSLIASGYPETRALYVETGNEVWNDANPFWYGRDYFHGIRDWANDRKPVAGYGAMVGAGFMEARFAVALDAALARAGRKQAVVFILACQHANTATCDGVANGFRHYFGWAGIDPAPFLAHAGLSTATYFQDGVSKLFPGATAEEKTATWLAAIKADPQGTATALTDWYLKTDQCCTIPYLVRMRRAQRAIAAKAGIAFIGDYEGEAHETAFAPLRDNPAFRDWYFNVWMDGPEGERLTREWAKALLTDDPEAIVSAFVVIGRREIVHPWLDGLYGEATGRRRALEEFLRP